MLKKVFTTFLLVLFSSCHFRVIYEDRTDVVSYANELAAIRIKKDRDRLGQELKNNLYDILNPDYIKAEPKYFLTLSIRKASSSTFTTSTGASGRNKVTLDVDYELKNLESAALISKGSTSVNDNYDVTTNRYGTYVADEYINTNLTKIVAQNIRNSLVNDLIEVKKKCAEKSDEKVDQDKEEDVENKVFKCPLNLEEIKQ